MASSQPNEESGGGKLCDIVQRMLKRVKEDSYGAPPDPKTLEILSTYQELLTTLEEYGEDKAPPHLVEYIREMETMLNDYEECGSDEDEEAEFVSRVAQKIASSPGCKHGRKSSLEVGIVAMVHSLQSATGKKINGQRALVIRYHPDQERWEVRLEFEEGHNATKALKGANLTPLRRLPLPTVNIEELLILSTTLTMSFQGCSGPGREAEFRPSDIIFTGYGSMAFQRMGESNFMLFVNTQIEQMGGVLGLGNLAREWGERGTAALVFGLLEGDEMYVDVLIQTMHWTGEIIHYDWDSGYDGRPGFGNDCPPTQLTPDQDTEPYVRTMNEGPVLMLECVAKYNFAPALWAALAKSEFYHLLVQRLLRWAARETLKTRDGKALGGKARKILSGMFAGISGLLKQIMSVEASQKILLDSSTLLSNPSLVTTTTLKNILESDPKA
ncbi:hypothetical protein ACHAWF_014236 [Thalassiosira exigua]